MKILFLHKEKIAIESPPERDAQSIIADVILVSMLLQLYYRNELRGYNLTSSAMSEISLASTESFTPDGYSSVTLFCPFCPP